MEEDKRRRAAIKQRSARVLNSFSSETIDETQQLHTVHIDQEQRSGDTDGDTWVPGSNVDPLFRLKATVPGDIAVRFAAIVIVILIIAYK